MELQFNRSNINCLKTLTRRLQTQELTQELRLPEGMPDIGRVLGCWSQVILRGKEWRNGSIGATGGAKVWTLYEPEDGGNACCMESWLPFQLKWEIPDTRHDGSILLQPYLRSTDARTLSARKMLLRVDLGMLAEAVVSAEAEVFKPAELSEDIQLLRKNYPVMIPKETGEKAFTIEETLTLPASNPQPVKLVRYDLRPELVDKKVMGDKVIFRGAALGHILYQSEDGHLHGWDFEIPFSQYAQLDNDYSENATVGVIPVLTELELERNENGGFNLKAGMTGQFVVYETEQVEVVEDAYSTSRTSKIKMQTLELPVILDKGLETIRAEVNIPLAAELVADVAFYCDYPRLNWEDDETEAELTGCFQLLYYDDSGRLQNTSCEWRGAWKTEADRNADVQLRTSHSGVPLAMLSADNLCACGDLLLEVATKCQHSMEMVTELELGEKIVPDGNRPSLILRRAGEEGLWQIAKETGSTIDLILRTNGLSQEPEAGKMLLIPVV